LIRVRVPADCTQYGDITVEWLKVNDLEH